MAKLEIDVNHNKTKKGIKVQFVFPQNIEGDQKAAMAQKLQSKLNKGLAKYKLSVNQDTDVPFSNVIGFLIPLADFRLMIKNAIEGGGEAAPAPEEPAPEEPIKENLSYDYQEDKIIMNDDTKDAILDNPELQSFITPKSFVRNKKGQIVLWVDWMEPEEFDKLANFLGIKY